MLRCEKCMGALKQVTAVRQSVLVCSVGCLSMNESLSVSPTKDRASPAAPGCGTRVAVWSQLAQQCACGEASPTIAATGESRQLSDVR